MSRCLLASGTLLAVELLNDFMLWVQIDKNEWEAKWWVWLMLSDGYGGFLMSLLSAWLAYMGSMWFKWSLAAINFSDLCPSSYYSCEIHHTNPAVQEPDRFRAIELLAPPASLAPGRYLRRPPQPFSTTYAPIAPLSRPALPFWPTSELPIKAATLLPSPWRRRPPTPFRLRPPNTPPPLAPGCSTTTSLPTGSPGSTTRPHGTAHCNGISHLSNVLPTMHSSILKSGTQALNVPSEQQFFIYTMHSQAVPDQPGGLLHKAIVIYTMHSQAVPDQPGGLLDNSFTQYIHKLVEANSMLLVGFNLEDYFPSLGRMNMVRRVVCARPRRSGAAGAEVVEEGGAAGPRRRWRPQPEGGRRAAAPKAREEGGGATAREEGGGLDGELGRRPEGERWPGEWGDGGVGGGEGLRRLDLDAGGGQGPGRPAAPGAQSPEIDLVLEQQGLCGVFRKNNRNCRGFFAKQFK
uniref:PH01B001I13.8 protein n=1 Tax=Phyllostachys edulis TaxID=38705 RepID=L0P2D6_PHYED|nr:PH01B001I13.8 [Phyllostachys edulis]